MQPQRRPRGRPPKKRRKTKGQDRRERSRAPSPSPSRAASPSPSHAASPSPSCARPLNDLDDDNGPSDTGDPERKRDQVPSPGPSRARPAGDVDDDDDEPFDSDAGDPKLLRDLHAGLKPTPLDEAALDEEVSDEEGEIEDDLPYGADKEVNSGMVDMMLELGDCNEDDMEWLPAKERKKVDARKRGIVSTQDANVRKTYQAVRKEKDPLPWA
jgi:hypothetical protein